MKENKIVPENEVWQFTEPTNLGEHYVLENQKFWKAENGNLIEIESYMDIVFRGESD